MSGPVEVLDEWVRRYNLAGDTEPAELCCCPELHQDLTQWLLRDSHLARACNCFDRLRCAYPCDYRHARTHLPRRRRAENTITVGDATWWVYVVATRTIDHLWAYCPEVDRPAVALSDVELLAWQYMDLPEWVEYEKRYGHDLRVKHHLLTPDQCAWIDALIELQLADH